MRRQEDEVIGCAAFVEVARVGTWIRQLVIDRVFLLVVYCPCIIRGFVR